MPDVNSAGPQKPGPIADLFAGTKYSTIGRLAAGGMGEVFLVLHGELRKDFVIKVLHERFAANAQLLDRVRIEAQIMGRLAHRHIVAVVDFGVMRDGRPFIVMERLIGRTLAAELTERGALPPLEAVGYILQLLSALEATHALGIVHRDLKPGNLFLVKGADGQPSLKLLDFGIARVLPGYADAAPRPLAVPTGTGVVVGTPRFVSPEAALGKRVDARADVYAAGLILYLLLVGKGPFDHLRSDAQILGAHINLEPVAPSAAAGIPPSQAWPKALDEVVLRALSKNPAARFQSAKQFGEVLQRVLAAIDAHLPQVAEDSHSTAAAEVERPLSAARLLSNEAIESEPAGTASERVEIPVSLPSVRQLLLFCAVVAATAVAVSQLARRALSVWL